MDTQKRIITLDDISLQVITGSMFSGKTEEMIRRLNRDEVVGLKTVIIRPSIDIRSQHALQSHSKITWAGHQEYIDCDKPEKAIEIATKKGYNALGFDECQFYSSPEIVTVLLRLAYAGRKIYATMLDLDFRGLPYGYAPQITSVATSVDKLTALCSICKNEATRTQRLDDVGNPVVWNDQLNLIGDEKVLGCRYYLARCTNHHIVLDENGKRVIVLDSKGTLVPWEQFVSIE